jgi:hypothetical protein
VDKGRGEKCRFKNLECGRVMNNSLKVKTLVGLSLGLFAAVLLGLSYSGLYDLNDPLRFMRAYSVALSVTTAVVGLLLWQGWKIPIFQGWLILVPSLNGTWEGDLSSDWVNPETNEGIAPIKSILVIRQTLFGISCVVRTGEMTSFSISAGIERDKNNHIEKLVYTYRSEPKASVSKRSAIHHGTAVLEFGRSPNWVLSGRYFTERKTTGELKLAFRDRKTNTQLTDAESQHPMDKT